jgi:hypothetical protein
LRADAAGRRQGLDWLGIGLVSTGLFGLVFGFSHASTAGWSNLTTLGCIGAGAMLLSGFIYSQTRAFNPVLPLRVMLDRNRAAAYLAIFMIALG